MLRNVRTFASVGTKGKKAAAKKAAKQAADAHRGRPVEFGPGATGLEKQLTSLLRPVMPPPKKSPAERAELRVKMIKYGKLKRAQHIEMEMRMARFMHAKWAALDAMPNYRRVEAMAMEPKTYPRNRPIFTDTPPIKGFNSGDITKPS